MSKKNKNKNKNKPASAAESPRSDSGRSSSESAAAVRDEERKAENTSSEASSASGRDAAADASSSEELDEAQRAGQRRPEPAPDIPMIFPIKETDDLFVRGFKTLLQGIVDRWRVLVVFGVIGLVIVLAVAITLGERRAEEQRAWEQYLSRQTVPELEVLTDTHRGLETLPWVYLRLVERLEEQARDDDDRRRLLERISTRIDEFLHEFGDDERFAADVRRLQTRRAEVERDLEVLAKIAEREEEEEEDAEATRPQPTVYEPDFDAEAGRYEPLPNPVVVFETEDGTELRFELFEDRTPNTVANLIWLIEQGFYDNDGPGGWMETDGPSTDPQQRLIGRFVDKGPPIRDLEEMLEGDGPVEQRVQQLDERWHDAFARRSIGYTIPFESSGARKEVLDAFGEVVERRVRRVRPGDLVMDMEPPDRERRVFDAKPGAAEGAFRVVRSRVPQYDGRYVIFGRIADEETAEALDQLPEETAMRRAWAEAVRPKLTPRTVAVRPELDERFLVTDAVERVMEREESLVHGSTFWWSHWATETERALERRGPVIERLREAAFVERTPRGTLRRVDDASDAQHLALHPSQVETVPPGEGYRDPAGEVHAAEEEAEETTLIDWFEGQPEIVERHRVGAFVSLAAQPSRRGALFPGQYDEEALRLLPPTRAVYRGDGELVPREYRPMVRYFYYETLDADPQEGFIGDIIHFPALMPAQETRPDRLPTIDLFRTAPRFPR